MYIVWYCLPPPSNISGKGQRTRASTTCAIEISKLSDNCITVVGSRHIVIHVQQWILNLCCVLAVYIEKNEKHLTNEQKVGMLLQKRTNTRGVGISSMKKSIYLLTTTPSSHTHRFHPLSTIVIHTLNLCKVQSMDDNCGEWVESMGVASGCG